ncbi:MAG: cytochrome c [Nitrospirae bacterium]|nr:cytochrome c [Nitrospirota bacterium]
MSYKFATTVSAIAVICVALSQGCSKSEDVRPEEKQGRAVYLEYCSQCHSLREPNTHTAAEWPDVVRRMRTHMAEKKRKELSDEQAGQLLVYLKGHAKK